MSAHDIHYAEHVEHVETPDLPHHIAVGGYPELAQQHCKLEERVAKQEARIDELELRLVRLYGMFARHAVDGLL